MPTRYYLRLQDPATARGPNPALAFRAHGADAFADELQQALRSDALFERWRALQDEPDDVDPALGATDPAASVTGMRGSPRSINRTSTATTSAGGLPLSRTWPCSSVGPLGPHQLAQALRVSANAAAARGLNMRFMFCILFR